MSLPHSIRSSFVAAGWSRADVVGVLAAVLAAGMFVATVSLLVLAPSEAPPVPAAVAPAQPVLPVRDQWYLESSAATAGELWVTGSAVRDRWYEDGPTSTSPRLDSGPSARDRWYLDRP